MMATDPPAPRRLNRKQRRMLEATHRRRQRKETKDRKRREGAGWREFKTLDEMGVDGAD